MSTTNNNGRMVVLGDSVTWGQGLLLEHKYSTLVFEQVTGVPSTPERMQVLAHSGAVIGWHSHVEPPQTSVHPEVPEYEPSIFKQLSAVDTSDVKIVLVNGGINDIDIRTILNPVNPAKLADLTEEYCWAHLLALLRQIAETFTATLPQIVVTGYFPILSNDSKLKSGQDAEIEHFLHLFEVSVDDLTNALSALDRNNFLDPIIARCQIFWQVSQVMMARAVADAQKLYPAHHFCFAQPAFTDRNAALASDPWLNGLTNTLDPEDEVIELRKHECQLAYPFDVLNRFTCDRASAGHPNKTGAQQFAQAIMTCLQP